MIASFDGFRINGPLQASQYFPEFFHVAQRVLGPRKKEHGRLYIVKMAVAKPIRPARCVQGVS